MVKQVLKERSLRAAGEADSFVQLST